MIYWGREALSKFINFWLVAPFWPENHIFAEKNVMILHLGKISTSNTGEKWKKILSLDSTVQYFIDIFPLSVA